MKFLQNYDEALLNALFDNELGEFDSHHLLDELRNDETISARLGRLKCTQSLLRHAYKQTTLPTENHPCDQFGSDAGHRSFLTFTSGLIRLVDNYNSGNQKENC